MWTSQRPAVGSNDWLDGDIATRSRPDIEPPIDRRGYWETHEQHNRGDMRNKYVRQKAGTRRRLLLRLLEDRQRCNDKDCHKQQHVNDWPDSEEADDYGDRLTDAHKKWALPSNETELSHRWRRRALL